MQPNPNPNPDPQFIYLDASFLVDLADSSQSRHIEAMQLLNIFRKHKTSGSLRLLVSLWAITETHGILYEAELKRRGIGIPNAPTRNPRNFIPPPSAHLLTAKNQIDNLVQTLIKTTALVTWPLPGLDSTPVWHLAMQIAEEAAIWPTDSMHLAIALQQGCTMIISDDNDFLTKIECCQQHLIQPYRQAGVSSIPNPTPFIAHGVFPTMLRIPYQPRRTHIQAKSALRMLGFS